MTEGSAGENQSQTASAHDHAAQQIHRIGKGFAGAGKCLGHVRKDSPQIPNKVLRAACGHMLAGAMEAAATGKHGIGAQANNIAIWKKRADSGDRVDIEG